LFALAGDDADAFRARTPTLAAFYERTYYGGFMPLLYGYPADLAYFARRARERGLDVLGTIDRYLAVPMLHELCHFARDREALLPAHLDECIAGWIGVHVWPAMAFPDDDGGDAIYAAPWLSQVGQAVARAFGVHDVIRAHAGHAAWDAALPRRFLDTVTRVGWDDWCKRRTQHFLSDTFDPDPWVNLVLELAGPLREDPDFDRRIVRDALRSMCLRNERVDGSFRARSVAPEAPIAIAGGRVVGEARGIDTIAPRYWLPPAIVASLAERGITSVRIPSLAAIDEIVDDWCR
jgi:hypothetical protein